MTQPHELTVRHLKITFTPAEYDALISHKAYQHAGQFFRADAKEDYWGNLSEYVLARFPFCKTVFTETLDTHGLSGWIIHPDFANFVYKRPKSPYDYPCVHFVAVQTFINLHGIVPDELKYFSNQSEVPFVMPVFVPDDLQAYAVMHSLPICRIENGQFVPRYSLYTIAYYSNRPDILRERRRAEYRGEDYGHFPMLYTWRTLKFEHLDEAWDLPLWVQKGKLLWLDLEQNGLPLKSEPVEAFPYADIEGMRKSYRYHQGQLNIDVY
jgi:hypothetical protein